jgi:hypothetical protein
MTATPSTETPSAATSGDVIPVQSPLHLVVKLKSVEAGEQMKAALLSHLGDMQQGMYAVGTVHFAHWFFFDPTTVALMTVYDGSFEKYIMDFVQDLGDLFNALLPLADSPPPLPVQQYPQEFTAWIHERDIPVVGHLISAFPTLTVAGIKDLEAQLSS